MSAAVVWIHKDGRRIEVFQDRKVRHFERRHRSGGIQFDGRSSEVFRHDTPPTDEWPILERSTVPTLTDDDWYASPGPDWTKADA